MEHDDVSGLRQLGNAATQYQYDAPGPTILETFLNKNSDQDYQVELIFPEFTSLCPKTGQPDFGKIIVRYIPDKVCVESKSFKLYMFAFRYHQSFMETMTNKILHDLVSVCSPRWMEVQGLFNARGGLVINVTASFGMK